MRAALAFAAAVCLLWSAMECYGLPSLPAKCTACKAIAAELSRRIADETPRNHLDMRHRLDSEGQRYGRVLPYKSSELRAVELLEGLCKKVKDYALVWTESGGEDGTPKKKKQFWAKVSGQGKIDTSSVKRKDKYEEEAIQKRLEIFCGAVMEEYEDLIQEDIMAGKMDQGPELLESHMCGSVTKLCPLKRRPAPPADDAAAAAEGTATPPAAPAGDEMVIDGDAAEVLDNPEGAAAGGEGGEKAEL